MESWRRRPQEGKDRFSGGAGALMLYIQLRQEAHQRASSIGPVLYAGGRLCDLRIRWGLFPRSYVVRHGMQVVLEIAELQGCGKFLRYQHFLLE